MDQYSETNIDIKTVILFLYLILNINAIIKAQVVCENMINAHHKHFRHFSLLSKLTIQELLCNYE